MPTVELTKRELKAVRIGLVFGVPDPPPEDIRTARLKLLQAEREAEE